MMRLSRSSLQCLPRKVSIPDDRLWLSIVGCVFDFGQPEDESGSYTMFDFASRLRIVRCAGTIMIRLSLGLAI
eukprot:scaffold34622_cov162-Amphora_coffeaeformis.AAC.4